MSESKHKIKKCDEPSPGWYYIDNLFYRIPSTDYSKNICDKPAKIVNIAGFDLHETLIVPKEGQSGIKGPTNWQWTFSSVPDVLNKYHRKGWIVVIFSNHSRVERFTKQQDSDNFMTMMEYIISLLDFEPYVFISMSKKANREDKYSKPAPGMFSVFSGLLGIHTANISSKSFFTGDKAGKDNKDPRYNKAGTDRDFATAIHLYFYTPSEIFEGNNE